MKKKNWLIAIPVLMFLLMSNVGIGDSSTATRMDNYEIAQKEQRELIKERATISDSLEYFISEAKYNYSLSKGKIYRLEHVMPDSIHVWTYRIVRSVEGKRKWDTVYVGCKATKR